MFKNRLIFLYYLILFALVLFRTSEGMPSILLRIFFLALFIIPLLFINKQYFPPILICFMTVATNGFAFNYLPYEMYMYFVITIGFILMTRPQCLKSQISLIYLSALILVLFRNILDSFQPQNIFYCMAIIGMFSLLVDSKTLQSKNNMLVAFVFASIGLSFLYLFNYDKYLVAYDSSQGLERSGWIDPNYFSSIIGIGVLSSIVLMMQCDKLSKLSRLALVLTIVVCMVSQILLASRGGILAVVASCVFILLFSKIKLKYKVLSVLIASLLGYIIYNAGFSQLLQYRIQNDAGGGSGRLDIWAAKLSAFASDGNIVYWLVGYGYKSGFELTGIGENGVGFHNDFLAILCDYGIVGLLMFIYFICYPLLSASKKDRPIVLSLLIYLVVVCATLEPFSSGSLPFFGFYFLIYLISKKDNAYLNHSVC